MSPLPDRGAERSDHRDPVDSGQHRAKRGDRRHEEVCRSRQLDELLWHFESRPSVPGRIVRIRLIDLASAIAGGLSNDRVKPRRYPTAAPWPNLPVNKIGIVRVAPLNELELPLDRGLIADEHQSSAVPGCCFSGCHFGTKRDTGANDAVPLHLRLAAPRVVTGVHLSDMCGVGTFALIGIRAELEIIISPLITAQRRICRAAVQAP